MTNGLIKLSSEGTQTQSIRAELQSRNTLVRRGKQEHTRSAPPALPLLVQEAAEQAAGQGQERPPAEAAGHFPAVP